MALELPAEPEFDEVSETVRLPAPTAWPIVLAFGMTLIFSGLLTTPSVSVLGAILAIAGAVGWFREILPLEKHESVAVSAVVPLTVTSHPQLTHFDSHAHEMHRARLPLEIYPVSAGVKGGLAGGVA